MDTHNYVCEQEEKIILKIGMKGRLTGAFQSFYVNVRSTVKVNDLTYKILL